MGDAIETYSFGSGDDTTTIRGFLGALQRLDMGGGDDRLTLRSPRDDSFIASGGDGVDTLRIEVFSSQETTTVDLAAGEVRIGDFSVQFRDFKIFEGSPGPYSFIGSDQADIIFAAGLDDTISAGTGDDSLFAGFGDDIINAGDGDDTINAGTANDLVFAGAGDDLIFGGGGDDTLHGEAGSDVINGGDGMDQAVFEDGLDAFSFFRAGDVLLVRHDATGDIDAVRADVEVLSFMSEIASHADLLLQASFSPLADHQLFQRMMAMF
ncbi:MAG: calcium-binding protein [Paracoccaceae bacterium]|nr:calcium-binding protein [Paracoccaceae bacterium]